MFVFKKQESIRKIKAFPSVSSALCQDVFSWVLLLPQAQSFLIFFFFFKSTFIGV